MMIDIDAHEVGGLKEAMQFANHLKNKFFPSCYIETSTNGNGAHIFLIIDKTDWADVDYNAVLKEFDHWLKGVLAETGIAAGYGRNQGASAQRCRGRTACPSTRLGHLPNCPGSGNGLASFGKARSIPPISCSP